MKPRMLTRGAHDRRRFLQRAGALATGAMLGNATTRAGAATARPAIAIIVDDLGYREDEAFRALALPGPVACAFLPYTPHAHLAERARALGKEVLLHVPMEAQSGKALGPGGLTMKMTHDELDFSLNESLNSVPNVVGISNHMGSAMTRSPQHMAWVMRTLRKRGRLYFVDSVTSPRSVAFDAARHAGVAAIRRDIFLDSVQERRSIALQFEQLVAGAKRHGTALGIAHPYPETMDVLEAALPALDRYGVELLPVGNLILRRMQVKRSSERAKSTAAG